VPDTDEGAPSPTGLPGVLLEARTAGFLGPGPIAPHLDHAQGFVALARQQGAVAPAGPAPRVLDLGSGGGLPGLVLALEWPEAELVLLDAQQRRTEFLRRAVDRLGLGDRVQVVHDRAEVAGRDPELRGRFDGVVVRSFGPPAVVAECAAPFLRTGGWLIVSEPPGESPSRWPAERLRTFGLVPEALRHEGFGFQLLRQIEPCPERFPRRDGVPARKPLF
jgi:16S rRNA (guanine527-N7)-methyltransferase